MTTHHPRPLSPPHRSFWLQDAGARAATPPLGSDIPTDVAIVGGGYLGLWPALRLRAAVSGKGAPWVNGVSGLG